MQRAPPLNEHHPDPLHASAGVGRKPIRDPEGIHAYQINPMHPYNIATQYQANRMCSTGVVIASLAVLRRGFLGLVPGILAPRDYLLVIRHQGDS